MRGRADTEAGIPVRYVPTASAWHSRQKCLPPNGLRRRPEEEGRAPVRPEYEVARERNPPARQRRGGVALQSGFAAQETDAQHPWSANPLFRFVFTSHPVVVVVSVAVVVIVTGEQEKPLIGTNETLMGEESFSHKGTKAQRGEWGDWPRMTRIARIDTEKGI
jgi:hypothetical protein